MSESENWLLCNRLRTLLAGLDGGLEGDDAEAAWRRAEEAVTAAGAEEDADVMLPVLDRSVSELRALVDSWDAGTGHLSEWDRAVLKRALKAYKKRLKLLRLDDESSGSRNPLSKGETSSITGVKPPDQYAQDVWDMLIAQGKLRDAGHGLLELTTT